MKANEFVKKFGWGDARFHLGNAHKDALWVSFDLPEHGIRDIVIYVPDLKHLVESHELVESYGGLEKARLRCYPAKHLTMQSYHTLRDAIADVESCQ